MLERLIGGPLSEVDERVWDGRAGRPPPVMVGTLSLLLALLPGMTLFLMPRPVSVSPLSGSRIGMWTALPVLSKPKLVSISWRSGVKFESHNGMTSSGSGGGSGYPCSCEYWCSTVYKFPIKLFCRTIWFARRCGRIEKVAAFRRGRRSRRFSSASWYAWVERSRSTSCLARALFSRSERVFLAWRASQRLL